MSPRRCDRSYSPVPPAVADGAGAGAEPGAYMANEAAPTHEKPLRLSLACNQCRKRKVRCDARQPKCRNCSSRGDVCETTDPRKPGTGPALRKRASRRWQAKTSDDNGSAPSAAGDCFATVDEATRSSTRDLSYNASRGIGHLHDHPSAGTQGSATPAQGSPSPSAFAAQDQQRRTTRQHISWVSRGYQESTVDQAQQSGREQPSSDEATVVTPDVIVNTDSSSNKVKFMGGSSCQCLFTFVDLHLASHGFSPAAPLFKHGMLHSEEFPIPLFPEIPSLPDRTRLSDYVDAFFSRVWPVYPAVDRAAVDSDIDNLLALQAEGPSDLQTKLRPANVPTLAAVYAIICIGMKETPNSDSELSNNYLRASYSLHGHLTAVPYLPSTQALLLLALALRASFKDGQAWHIVGHAIRMAQSLGLHKLATRELSAPGKAPNHQQDRLRERVWWSCYALEKLMQLECGRPSGIDNDYDYLSGNCSIGSDSGDASTYKYFTTWVSLAGIMGQISDRLYSHRFCGSEELFVETARLDSSLTEWEVSLPDDLKPRNILADHPDEGHRILASFISQQHYHAQIAVLRVSLVFPRQSYISELEKRREKIPSHLRLLNGASICAHAARAEVTQTLQLADSGVRSTLMSVPQTFLASVVLALSILRRPSSRLARSDIELLVSATEYVESWYCHWGFNPAFVQICTHLRSRVVSVFQKANGRCSNHDTTAEGAPFMTTGTDERVYAGPMGDNVDPAQPTPAGHFSEGAVYGMEGMAMPDPSVNVFESLEFEDLWNMMDSDFLLFDPTSS